MIIPYEDLMAPLNITNVVLTNQRQFKKHSPEKLVG